MPASDFKVLRACGKGSFATVFQVRRLADGQTYALKRVSIGNMSAKEIQDCLNEMRFLASLRHANIVGFMEAFVDKGNTELCTVMEFCGNGDLRDKIKRHRQSRRLVDERLIWGYVIQMAQALKTLHAKGIIHRDVKAANVFVSEDGTLKLGDMNVSKRMKGGQMMQTQVGTPYFMAPEIHAMRKYCSACDIWSLGCLVYELCALQPPFQAETFSELRKKVLTGVFPSIPRQYTYDMSNLVSGMLRVRPQERPSAEQLLATPSVLKYSKYKPGHLDYTQEDLQPGNELMATIMLPRKRSLIQHHLPKPSYPEGEQLVIQQQQRQRQKQRQLVKQQQQQQLLVKHAQEQQQLVKRQQQQQLVKQAEQRVQDTPGAAVSASAAQEKAKEKEEKDRARIRSDGQEERANSGNTRTGGSEGTDGSCSSGRRSRGDGRGAGDEKPGGKRSSSSSSSNRTSSTSRTSNCKTTRSGSGGGSGITSSERRAEVMIDRQRVLRGVRRETAVGKAPGFGMDVGGEGRQQRQRHGQGVCRPIPKSSSSGGGGCESRARVGRELAVAKEESDGRERQMMRAVGKEHGRAGVTRPAPAVVGDTAATPSAAGVGDTAAAVAAAVGGVAGGGRGDCGASHVTATAASTADATEAEGIGISSGDGERKVSRLRAALLPPPPPPPPPPPKGCEHEGVPSAASVCPPAPHPPTGTGSRPHPPPKSLLSQPRLSLALGGYAKVHAARIRSAAAAAATATGVVGDTAAVTAYPEKENRCRHNNQAGVGGGVSPTAADADADPHGGGKQVKAVKRTGIVGAKALARSRLANMNLIHRAQGGSVAPGGSHARLPMPPSLPRQQLGPGGSDGEGDGSGREGPSSEELKSSELKRHGGEAKRPVSRGYPVKRASGSAAAVAAVGIGGGGGGGGGGGRVGSFVLRRGGR